MTTTATEAAEQRGVPVSFRCPVELAEAADKAAGRELISRSAFARRALLAAVRAAGVEPTNIDARATA
jgi:Ribbon-helix-helix protein, copG family